MLLPERQAGAFPNLPIPEGLTLEDLEVAEDMIMDWCESAENRAVDTVIKLFQHLQAARLANLSGTS
jgi:hypothetical protein